MVYTKCENCGVSLEIDEDDYMPGCRETENVSCPSCKKVATTVFTSGIPRAYIVSDEVIDKIKEEFDF
ncbi:primosomal protein N' [Clostridium beijerinckii]|uniref:hypothetical protein n=1 Tax=Clostridium beijerinckii TaxID=1520 RepID=UPI001493E535|nr:hypothetical protein [Clostridium beijerinckii]NOW87953.1 primosomal protein N' [Clostridium beijerinckii]